MDKKYPEHEKLAALGGESQVVGNFISWLGEQGYVLAKWNDDDDDDDLMPARKSTTDLLAEFFEIDPKKLEAEKQEMLAGLRSQVADRVNCREE